MKKILVLGSYGFIGKYIVDYFQKKGMNVIKLGHSKDSKDGSSVNICNLDKLSDIDYIINCAGSGDVRKSFLKPLDDFEKNVYLLEEVLEYARKCVNKPKIIQLSSAAVYGVVPDIAIKEENILNPISPYGYHKRIAEEMCENYSRFFGIDISVIRLFSVYGNNLKKQLLWDACNKFQFDEKVSFFGTGKETRDFLHVRDVCRLIDNLIISSRGFEIINGGVGRRIELNYVISLIAKEFNKEYLFNNEVKEGDPTYYLADIAKLNEISFLPTVKLEYGIKEYTNWYKTII